MIAQGFRAAQSPGSTLVLAFDVARFGHEILEARELPPVGQDRGVDGVGRSKHRIRCVRGLRRVIPAFGNEALVHHLIEAPQRSFRNRMLGNLHSLESL